MDICIFLYRISKTLWECCSYWSGLSVTNEPSGTGTGIPAKDVISGSCVATSSTHRFVCLCEWEQYLVWPVGLWKLQASDSTGLCCAPANLLNCKAWEGSGGGVKERSRPFRKLSPAVWSRLPGFVHSFSFPPTNVEQNTGDMILEASPVVFHTTSVPP